MFADVAAVPPDGQWHELGFLLCGVWFVSAGGAAQAQVSEGELILPGAGG